MRLTRENKQFIGLMAALLLMSGVLLSFFMCISAWVRWGLNVEDCPDGTPRQTAWLEATSLRRSTSGRVHVSAIAHYTVAASDGEKVAEVGRASADVFLVDGQKETRLEPSRKGWRDGYPIGQDADITLPDVPDGDYLLRAKVHTPLGETIVDAPLAIYAPARIHVLTDRPLYEPGNTVRFRAVALRARDLTPLDKRPGRWMVTDPQGETLLEEKAPAGEWGVISGTFPLASDAPSGGWKVAWVSGDARGEASFTVEPFTLPRFTVEATPTKPFWRAGEKPTVKGSVTYSSGAPVSNARLQIEWNHQGEWPPPLDWMAGTLPTLATADAGGRFTLALPMIPGDLKNLATLRARVMATDAAGDHAETVASILLAEDAIAVSTVTELADGLVQGFNNRLFIRLTDASGVVLPKADLVVKRAWDPSDKGVKATADEDGVAALQIDPGPAVNVVIPAMPYRPRPPEPAVTRRNSYDRISTSGSLGLADQRALDGFLRDLNPCARFGSSGAEAVIGVRVSAAGEVVATGSSNDFGACIAQALRAKRLPASAERFFQLTYAAGDAGMPTLSASNDGIPNTPDVVTQAMSYLALDARSCLPQQLSESARLARIATWRVKKGSREVAVTWSQDPIKEGRTLGEAMGCVEGRVRPVALPVPADQDLVGIVRFTASPERRAGDVVPQPTTMLGYEFVVAASSGSKEIGSTKLRVQPGNVPPIRLRATPAIAKAGGKLTIDFLRGPSFSGELPEKLWMQTGTRSVDATVDRKGRKVEFAIPADAQGWLSVEWYGAKALAYVPAKAELAVALHPEKERYKPGETARLALTTTVGGQGARAAVGLFGVDETLAQLVPLPGADELASLRPKPQMDGLAFNSLDAQALTMGRIRGANAAVATVLKVNSVPPLGEIDSYVTAAGGTTFEPLEELTDRFYSVLAEVYNQEREWETKAPAAERMQPEVMSKLWSQALAACEKRGEKVEDAYGRRLKLSRLPQDLLALVDPRVVVIDGTRLPEDVENWPAWVAKEKP